MKPRPITRLGIARRESECALLALSQISSPLGSLFYFLFLLQTPNLAARVERQLAEPGKSMVFCVSLDRRSIEVRIE